MNFNSSSFEYLFSILWIRVMLYIITSLLIRTPVVIKASEILKMSNSNIYWTSHSSCVRCGWNYKKTNYKKNVYLRFLLNNLQQHHVHLVLPVVHQSISSHQLNCFYRNYFYYEDQKYKVQNLYWYISDEDSYKLNEELLSHLW